MQQKFLLSECNLDVQGWGTGVFMSLGEMGVGDTTFGPVAEGARRQGSKNIEANGSEHRRFPHSLVFRSQDEDSRGPVDGSVTARSK